MKTIKIEIPDNCELHKTSEGYKVVALQKPDLSIINDTDWFVIEQLGPIFVLCKKGILTYNRDSIRYVFQYDNLINNSAPYNEYEIKSIRLATLEEIEDFYTKFPQYRPEPEQKKWEEFGKIYGYKINEYSEVRSDNSLSIYNWSKRIFPSEAEAESALALSQLLQWRDKANGEKLEDWCDWSIDYQPKHVIYRAGNRIFGCEHNITYFILAFKTREIRDQFMIDHKNLLETYFMIKK